MADTAEGRTGTRSDCLSPGPAGLRECGGREAGWGGRVSELRIDHGPGYRVYFTRRGQTIIILLCGGDKSTQAKDIQTAKRLAEEWREENA